MQKQNLAVQDVIFQEWVLSEATHLARRGKYPEAKSLLESIPAANDEPEWLDLLARIEAQQGNFTEAERLWQKLLTIKPNYEKAMEGLKFIASSRKFIFNPWVYFVKELPLRIITLAGVLLVLWLVFGWMQQNRVQQVQVSTVPEPGPVQTVVVPQISEEDSSNILLILERQKTILEEVALLGTHYDQANTELMNAIKEQWNLVQNLVSTPQPLPQFELAVDGVEIIRNADKMTVIFNQGVFLYSTAFSEDGRRQLIELAQKLQPYARDIRIEIIGFSNKNESNEFFDLGLLRAVRAYDLMTANSFLPSEIFTIKPQAGFTPPHSGDPLDDRNRTVIFIIFPR